MNSRKRTDLTTFLWSLVLIFALTIHSGYASENPRSNEVEENKKEECVEPKSILPSEILRKRLEDPSYDVRFEKGTIQPWHDVRSIYLRRTVPVSNLA